MPSISIQRALPTLIIAPIMVTVGLTSWITYRGGQQAVDALAFRLSDEVSARITQHLNGYLTNPHEINRMNLDASQAGLLNLQEYRSVERYFWEQIRSVNVGYISFGTPKGEFIGLERLDNGELLINEVAETTGLGKLHVYQPDSRGQRGRLLETKPYDPRQEVWYSETVAAGKPIWSSIYQWEDKPDVVSITANQPVFDRQRQLLGILSVDVILSQLNQYLNQTEFSPSGRIFIVEPDGMLVASSAAALPFKAADNTIQRLKASQFSDRQIQLAAEYVTKRFQDWDQIQAPQQLVVMMERTRYFLTITPLRDQYGLSWFIVTVAPTSDFMGKVHANLRQTLLIGLAVASGAIVLGLTAAQWITRPLLRLSKSAAAIESGNFDPSQLQDVMQRQDEIGQLARVVDEMATVVYRRQSLMHSQLQQLQNANERAKYMVAAVDQAEPLYVKQLLQQAWQARRKDHEFQQLNLVELLRQVTYFASFSPTQLQALVNAGYRKIVQEGAHICWEGEPGDAFYIILIGSIKIYTESLNKDLNHLSQGQFFGELSLLLGIPRTASAQALEDSILFVIDRPGFQKFLRENITLADEIAHKINQYQSELEQRQSLLQQAGLVEDETEFKQNPLSWIRRRMQSLFNV
ncbi:cyclic nucleotide-binding domain-containing protein [Pantanalinema rosaneae CENA516]|uniref:cyclic nucleotide-binding domain-containing protein n=1 Tax=Pantanalinema rosaneae TaxID=1620701 RepID=UPI003D6F5C55